MFLIKCDLVLLDTNVVATLSSISKSLLVYELDGNIWVEKNLLNNEIEHGTSVLSVIAQHFYGDFIVFNIFKHDSLRFKEQLISALEFVYKNVECKFIQMSVGIMGNSDELFDVCQRLYERKIIIISAFNNNDSICYPASYDFVIGVQGDHFLQKKNAFYVTNEDIVDVFAPKKNFYALNDTVRYDYGNSIAASYVSLELLNANRNFANKQDVKKYLKALVNKDIPNISNSKIAVFPLNKENINLINYAESLCAKLVKVYDVKYLGNVNSELTSFANNKFKIENIENCDWESFDTLVIGHLRELSILCNRNYKLELLEKCLKYKKNAYCYDKLYLDIYEQRFLQANLNLYCPDNALKYSTQGKLYQINTPVICIFGTSKKIGKFTLQMQLLNLLKNKGYNVGFFGTEPNAPLLKSDEAVLLGYESSTSTMNAEYIMELINQKMHLIDLKNYDIIVSSAQSGFLPTTTFATNQINLNQYPFLFGVKFDSAILVVNVRDDISFIKRNIEVLQNISFARVLFIAVYAFEREIDNVIIVKKIKICKNELDDFKTKILLETGLETVVVGDCEENEKIFSLICDYYKK